MGREYESATKTHINTHTHASRPDESQEPDKHSSEGCIKCPLAMIADGLQFELSSLCCALCLCMIVVWSGRAAACERKQTNLPPTPTLYDDQPQQLEREQGTMLA